MTDARRQLLEALELAPIIGRDETAAGFRSRQDAWLDGPYRAAIANAREVQAREEAFAEQVSA
jgi:glycine/D-amino acid oxidase-like deaminating enzyme